MVEVRNAEAEIARLRWRLVFAIMFVTVLFGALVARFVWLQVYRHAEFHAQAEDNRIAVVPVPPARGLIYDRNGVLLAENVSAYTLELAPRQIANIEKTIDELAQVIDIGPRERRRFKRLYDDTKNSEWLPLKTRLTDEEVAKIAANRYRFEGVDVKARLFRNYPLGETASHVIGFIGRISPDEKRKIDDSGNGSLYAGSTHIGKVGVELSYEAMLHGETGFDEVEVSAGGRAVRSLSRNPATPGKNLILSIDVRLQKLVEEWYGERKGALVAIEPATGDVLAFVSKPTYDPNLFIDGIDPVTWKELNDDQDKPLLNRPLRGTYPPGSTYKPFMALAVLESGTRTAGATISDPGYFLLGGHRFRDSKPGGNGSVDLKKSIIVSSDTYYYSAAYDMGVDKIHDFMKPWGFGQITGIDIQNEVSGILPSSAWKMKRYKQKWLPGETPSIGIGQGYNSFTILQLAHATATLAAGGTVMRPHVVKSVTDPRDGSKALTIPVESSRIALKPEYLALVKQGMIEVNKVGTGRIAFAGAEYVAAGKTGTAQVIGIKQGEKYDAKKIAERYRDHSLFMAFAPADDPKVALALIVENGGFGAQAAAPIARKVFDYVLLGKLPKDTAKPFPVRPEIDDSEMRDVPENIEPEPLTPAQAARN
ncbi:MAG: penicillin-binding protein 2 [Burkholderiales bacterium]|nr:penicillin-binding protein 2 [Burkholderiales bacterium]